MRRASFAGSLVAMAGAGSLSGLALAAMTRTNPACANTATSARTIGIATANTNAIATKFPSDPRGLTLIDQRGSHFSLASLAGVPTLLTFIATRCTDTCPIVDGIFAHIGADQRARRMLPAHLVTVTLDPKFDTPFVLSQRAAALDAKPPAWRYAGGDPNTIAALLASLGVTTERDRHGVPEAHSSFVYLLDRHARLSRSFLLSNDLAREVNSALATMSLDQ